ncbi:hypothetical protein MMC26_000342 [Xylographa opegraphella]|nr:hypothetical protein [Xylographa opegraphella]
MASSTAAFPAVRSSVGRAVHIKIHPRPRTITESREVLRVLERYGEVIMFKHLKYEPHAPAPNSALAMYRNVEAAESAMKASPVSFVFGAAGNITERGKTTATNSQMLDSTQSNQDNLSKQVTTNGVQERDDGSTEKEPITKTPNAAAWGTTFPDPTTSSVSANPTATGSEWWPFPHLRANSASHSPTSPSNSGAGSPYQGFYPKPHLANKSSEPRREVSLSISPSGLNHDSYIARQYYYGQWWPNTRTIPGDDLSRKAPLQGFSDVRLNMPEVPVRLRMKREQESRDHRKRGLRRLRELWERGMRERGEEMRSWGEERVKTSKGWRTVAIDDNA